MKRFILIDYDNVIAVQTENELPSIDGWDKYKAYEIAHTEHPLPACLPQRLSINEMEVGDILINGKKLIGRLM